MSFDRSSIGDASFLSPNESGATPSRSYFGGVGRMMRASVRGRVWGDMWACLDRFLSSGIPNVPCHQVHNEDSFHYLLANERRRSERSGHSAKVLVAYVTSPERSIACMDPRLAHKLLVGLSRSLRETDYVGWYRAGMIVGGVLTTLGHDPIAEIALQVEQRFGQVLKERFSKHERSRIQFRVCHAHELEGIESEVYMSQSAKSL